MVISSGNINYNAGVAFCILSFIGFLFHPFTQASDFDESSSVEDANLNSSYVTSTLAPPRRSPTTAAPSDTPEEDKYIKYFGNRRYDHRPGWKIVQEWNTEMFEPKVRELCARAHEKIGYGKDVFVPESVLNLRELVFTNKNYTTRRIDVVTYRIEDGRPMHERRKYWYITEGIRPDCVFYLNAEEPRGRQFKLDKQVCGLKIY